MSYLPANEPECTRNDGAVDLIIDAKPKDLGGFEVRRVLPSAQRRMVGPFIFFDHIGPAEFPPGKGIQVRPHPHIGLATVTYLFDGEIMHRDSLGFAQPIRAGAVNLMTAGRGIVHSERAGEDLDTTSRLHGIQSWMALPQDQEECEPAFVHYPASELPDLEKNGNTIRLIIGEAFGIRSPVATRARMLYLECRMREGATLPLPDSEQELAAYVVSGQARIGDRSLGEGTMAVLHVGTAARMEANKESRVMIIGGEGLGERHIWWNFVSSSRERIRQASDDWRQERFAMVPGDDEFIPLPD